jgi:hypothetical protein
MRLEKCVRLAIGGLLAGGLTAGSGFAQQQIISAQSGTVQYVEGTVYADGQRVERKFGQFPSLREGDELRTEDGRAEVLLTPGAFLRLAENSSVRMVSNRLADTRLEVRSGTVMVECDELLKDNAVSLIYQGYTVHLQKKGLYRLDTESGEFRVYQGEALLQASSGQIRLTAGKQADLNGTKLAAQQFNPKQDMDDFYHWSSQRSSNLAYATITTSQSVLNTGTVLPMGGGWMWSSLLDEYTFLPGSGLLFSPFGWGFYSPLYMGYYYPSIYYPGGVPVGTAAASGFTGRSGSTVGRNGTTGTATNPNPGTLRAAPAFVSAGVPQSGTKYGGVAAAMPLTAATYRHSGGPRAGSDGSMVPNGNSSIGLRGSSGFSGGGFSGGGFHGGGGGHR